MSEKTLEFHSLVQEARERAEKQAEILAKEIQRIRELVDETMKSVLEKVSETLEEVRKHQESTARKLAESHAEILRIAGYEK